MNRWLRLGAGPSGRSGLATPLGAELHPCTHGSHELNMGIVIAHSRKFDIGLACLDECRVFVTPWGLGSSAIGKTIGSPMFFRKPFFSKFVVSDLQRVF